MKRLDIPNELKHKPGCCAIVALAIALALAACIGCSTGMQTYKEGTLTQIGAYLPLESSIVGVEVLNYLNGCKVTASTNTAFEVERQYAATNSYFFGMVETQEATATKVKVHNDK